MSSYDAIARLYDPWSTGVVEDIGFYVEEALAAGSPVVELGVGTGRIAIPTAAAGIDVIGVDSSAGMLAVCAERGRDAGVAERLDLRLGDLRRPPVDERVGLVTCPFRAYLHLGSDEERLEALARGADAARARRPPDLRRLPAVAGRHRRDRTAAGSSGSRASTSAPTGISSAGR